MPKVCIATGKRTRSGNNRSHAMNSSKRTFKPNLQKVRIIDEETGQVKRAWVSTSALRSGLVKRV